MASDKDFRIYTLHIEGVNIDNIPLGEIGEYIADLAHLLGKDVDPKFAGITKGSIRLKAKIRKEHEIDVKTRGFMVRTGDGPEEAVRAKARISERLGRHRAKRAALVDSANSKVIEIPVEAPSEEQINIPSLQKAGTIQGQVIKVGGKQETVPVEIQDVDEHVYGCRASRDVAKRLAKELFGSTVRAKGVGRVNYESGEWRIQDFRIEDFEILEDDDFTSVLQAIRAVPGAWKEREEDPLLELGKIRHGE